MIHTPPSSTATAGQVFGTQPVVYEEDQYGNLEAGDSTTVVSASLSSGTGPLQGSTDRQAVGRRGDVHEPGRRHRRDDRLKFGSGSLTPATATVTVAPSPASHLVVATPPPDPVTSGQSFTLVVWAEDKFNNVDTNYSGDVSASLCRRSRVSPRRCRPRTVLPRSPVSR